MWIRLFFFFLASQMACFADLSRILAIKRDLSLGFHERALSGLAVIEKSSDLSLEEKEQLALLRVEAIIRSGEVLDEREGFLKDSTNPSVKEQFAYWNSLSELNNGEYGKALESLEALMKKATHPYRDSILANVCQLYLFLGNTDAAHRQSKLLKPESLEAHAFLKAEVLIEIGLWQEAREVLSLIPQSKFSVRRDLCQGLIYYHEGEVEQAIKVLEKNEYPMSSLSGREALSLLSSLYYEKGEVKSLAYIKTVLMHASNEDALGTYFDQLLLSSQLEKDSRETLLFLEQLLQQGADELIPYILYTKAQLLKDASSRIASLSTLYTKYPSHTLAEKGSYSAALLAFQIKDPALRLESFNDILKNAPDSAVKAQVYAMLAEYATQRERAALYKKGLKYAETSQVPSLRLNHNLAQYQYNKSTSKDLILTSNDQATLLLERALSAQYKDPKRARQWLEEFLSIHEKHPRKSIAHLCLAELLLNDEDKSIRKTARAHLKTIESQYMDELEDKNRFIEANLRLAIEENDLPTINSLVRSPQFNNAGILQLGVLLYNSEYVNEASLLLKRLDPDVASPEEEGLADMYIALSYFKLGTAAHQEDALVRLERIAADKQSSLKTRARVLLAQHYFSKAQVEEALKEIKFLPESPDNLLLEAKALALSGEAKNMKKAAKIYRALYKDSSLPSTFRYNVVYQLALFQEANDLKAENLELYYQIANFEYLPKPISAQEWSLYKRLGDKAITLLESSGNWMTAFKFAQLLAKTNSPDKVSFQEKAEEISLKNILWDDGSF